MIEAHDIVRIHPSFMSTKEWPDWFKATDRLYATVRRAVVNEKVIPVGLRGQQRNQRFAFELPVTAVEEVIHPWELIQKDSFRQKEVADFSAYQAYIQARKLLQETTWGVGGSLGFELATDYPTIKETSDLDVLIYVKESAELPLEVIRQNLSLFSQWDTQVITKKGGFSLKEYLQNPNKKILLKTITGPILTDKLW
ncbi:malonate decarboxylase holo-ACP synthase [Enterococcus crotali]|uniref:malonate decarboxylase holo-ACP synthase n=1 Tax=Enterococcus crotali TaxID=1453587 RepID=UPI00046F6C98|nr:malonate decarboxylase holo-ACP synthase [Enterococcus crotali]